MALIVAILIGFDWWNRPTDEQLARQQFVRDSIAAAQAEAVASAAATDSLPTLSQGTAAAAPVIAAPVRPEQQYTLQNDLVKLTLSSKGGRVVRAELKNYKAYGDTVNPLCLFRADESRLNFAFATTHGTLNTADCDFEIVNPDSTGVTMRLLADSDHYIDLRYTLPRGEYMTDLSIVAHNMDSLLASNVNSIDIEWFQRIPQHEKGRQFENRYAQLQYNVVGDGIDKLSENEHSAIRESGTIRWLAYKDQFFSSVLIADGGLTSNRLESTPLKPETRYIKEYQTQSVLDFDIHGNDTTQLHLYYGPNDYRLLDGYNDRWDGIELESLVPLGWKVISWVNYLLVIPLFDFFDGFNLNIGLVILLLTLVIKLIVLPFVYKSYQSTAKMRVLRPQMEELNAKYPNPDQMQEKQMATMALYRRAGVSPMSGCLPMLLQMPILMAVFWFFPTAIELRGRGFLWADDLSTFDDIIHWSLNLPLIGDHLSLFCVLFTVVNCAYTYVNMQSQAGGNDPNMKMMKWMMYLMPVIFFFWFNDYPAGLSYYYLLSLLITIIEMMIFRWTTNDEKILAAMERNAAKRESKPKSRWMQKLEELQREQQRLAREQAKKSQRR